MILEYPIWTPFVTWIGLGLIFSQFTIHTYNDTIIFIGINVVMIPYYVMFYNLAVRQIKGDK